MNTTRQGRADDFFQHHRVTTNIISGGQTHAGMHFTDIGGPRLGGGIELAGEQVHPVLELSLRRAVAYFLIRQQVGCYARKVF